MANSIVLPAPYQALAGVANDTGMPGPQPQRTKKETDMGWKW